MTVLYRLSAVGLVFSLVVAATMLPDRVPVGFDVTGTPDVWRSKMWVILSVSGVSAILIMVFEVLIRVLPARGGGRLGLPHREHWVQPDNRARFRAMIATDVAFFGLCAMVLLSVMVIGAARVAQAGTEGLGQIGVASVLGFAMTTLTWLVWMFTTRYRPPGAR